MLPRHALLQLPLLQPKPMAQWMAVGLSRQSRLASSHSIMRARHSSVTATPADVFRDQPSSGTLQTSQHSNVSGVKRAASHLSGASKARVTGSKRSKPQQSSMKSFFVTREAPPAVAMPLLLHPAVMKQHRSLGHALAQKLIPGSWIALQLMLPKALSF